MRQSQPQKQKHLGKHSSTGKRFHNSQGWGAGSSQTAFKAGGCNSLWQLQLTGGKGLRRVAHPSTHPLNILGSDTIKIWKPVRDETTNTLPKEPSQFVHVADTEKEKQTIKPRKLFSKTECKNNLRMSWILIEILWSLNKLSSFLDLRES